MTRLSGSSHDHLVRRLRQLGFAGPFSGGRHLFMTRHHVRLILPNPHDREVSVDLLSRLLRQAGITRDEWQNLK